MADKVVMTDAELLNTATLQVNQLCCRSALAFLKKSCLVQFVALMQLKSLQKV